MAWQLATGIQVLLETGRVADVLDVYVYDGTDWVDVSETWVWTAPDEPPPDVALYDVALYDVDVYA